MKERNGKLYLAIAASVIVTLFTVHLALATSLKLSGTMPSFGDIQDFKISPDGEYVVYRADQDTNDVLELYSVPLTGGTPVRLNGALSMGSSMANEYKISPDSSRVVYVAPQDTTGVDEIYIVPIAGPAGLGVKLNGTLVTNGDVSFFFQISPDSSRVIYLADQDEDEVYEIYSVGIAGPWYLQHNLNGPLVAGGCVDDYEISPDSSRVVFTTDKQVNDRFELWSVPITGGTGVRLNETLVAGGDVMGIRISPDSSRVVYRADQDTDEVFELYSVPTTGPSSSGVELNKSLVLNGDVRVIYTISPNSSRVIYLADQDTDEVDEIYSVPLTGPAGAGEKLNGLLVAGGDVELWFQVSRDSSRVVYLADQQVDDRFEIYSVPLAGPSASGVKLNGSLVSGGNVDYCVISRDSSRVVYTADQQTNEVFELFSVPLAGSAEAGVKLNRELVVNGNVGIFRITLDSSRVIYIADQDFNERDELFGVPLAGPAEAGVKLNGALASGRDVFEFLASPDSHRVVYSADQDTANVIELYVVWDPTLYLPVVRQ